MPCFQTPRQLHDTCHLHHAMVASKRENSSPCLCMSLFEAKSLQLPFTAYCLAPTVLNIWSYLPPARCLLSGGWPTLPERDPPSLELSTLPGRTPLCSLWWAIFYFVTVRIFTTENTECCATLRKDTQLKRLTILCFSSVSSVSSVPSVVKNISFRNSQDFHHWEHRALRYTEEQISKSTFLFLCDLLFLCGE